MQRIIQIFRNLYNEYPRQYWLMIAGIVIATAGGSMIWPFMLIYASGKLNLPLSTVAALISINAGTGLVSSLIAGTLTDKIGRKAVMIFSLAVVGTAYYLMIFAQTYLHFAALMVMIGFANPLYQVGADAMLADIDMDRLDPPRRRRPDEIAAPGFDRANAEQGRRYRTACRPHGGHLCWRQRPRARDDEGEANDQRGCKKGEAELAAEQAARLHDCPPSPAR